MDASKYTTKIRKWQHLTSEERHDIEVHLKDGTRRLWVNKSTKNTAKAVQRNTVLWKQAPFSNMLLSSLKTKVGLWMLAMETH